MTSEAAKQKRGHVKKFVGSLNKEIPCSTPVLTCLKRRNKACLRKNALVSLRKMKQPILQTWQDR
ncbi:hypothetical protein PHMEG_00027898 [Phytophthora megakarya]|uniref:Uncharacterized protein n=1 Tax=Phytophthora megakarya TaxID=4795 RepID=A0A225V7U4_9STRA|nr:hypothetical protein PHMEG_00027898 [Phytophthora megakarya]